MISLRAEHIFGPSIHTVVLTAITIVGLVVNCNLYNIACLQHLLAPEVFFKRA